jgi:predicted metalloprotease
MKLGLGGALVLLVLSIVFKRDFFALVGGGGGGGPLSPPSASVTAPKGPVKETSQEAESRKLATFALNDTQRAWHQLLPALGAQYEDARLVLFRDAVRSGCGAAEASSGPFYCPADRKVYIDLAFYEELKSRFGAPGEFAQAYVIAHEVGHHVQNQLGIDGKVRRLQESRPGQANQLSVRLELQADCFAGVWGHQAAKEGRLEESDVEQGLNAAAAIGDDRIQKMSGRAASPESFTHGSSAQRVEWFRKGLSTGDPKACNTFGGKG